MLYTLYNTNLNKTHKQAQSSDKVHIQDIKYYLYIPPFLEKF